MLTGITWGAAILALAVLVFLVGFILIRGVKNLTLEQFAWNYNTENVTMLPAIINTVTMTVLSLLLAAPLGIFSAIYLVEYANKRGKLVGLIRITAETLSGIPSIVYGLFGMLFFTKTLKMGYSMMSGACTLAIMILPLIMRTAEEALKSVPDSIGKQALDWEPESFVRFLKLFFHLPYPAFFPVSFLRQAVS